jgi:hypothetical protein
MIIITESSLRESSVDEEWEILCTDKIFHQPKWVSVDLFPHGGVSRVKFMVKGKLIIPEKHQYVELPNVARIYKDEVENVNLSKWDAHITLTSGICVSFWHS